MIQTFTATHCGETYAGADGAERLEAHMREAHKLATRLPGGNARKDITDGYGHAVGTAPGWSSGKIQPSTPWKAPAVPKDWEQRLAATLTAHADHVIDGGELMAADGTYRWDDEAPNPPYAALPANVRTVLEAVVSRGERWAVKVSGSSVAVSLGRTPEEQAHIYCRDGRVSRTERTQMLEAHPRGLQPSTITKVREMFAA